MQGTNINPAPAPMTQEEVVALMESSRSEAEWNANCDAVKRRHGNQYPVFWYPAIILAGVAGRTAAKWGGDAEIKIKRL